MASGNRKIWIGHLDPKVTEFQLLKLVEPFGKIEKFDFLYSTNDKGERLPRGYVFVTFVDSANAQRAIRTLDGQKLLSQRMRVRKANSEPKVNPPRLKIPSVLSESSASEKELSNEEKIRALEEKLMTLDGQKSSEFKLTIPSASRRERKKPYNRP